MAQKYSLQIMVHYAVNLNPQRMLPLFYGFAMHTAAYCGILAYYKLSLCVNYAE